MPEGLVYSDARMVHAGFWRLGVVRLGEAKRDEGA
jgi:hypothetical protein